MENREIKFRAWDKNQMWITPIDTNYGLSRFFGVITEQAKLMQYTGLKDKNGVEIYEGDVVKRPNDLWIGEESVGEFKNTFVSDAFIEFVDGKFMLNKLGDPSKNYYGVIQFSKNNKCEKLEVIGNIYQNPELL